MGLTEALNEVMNVNFHYATDGRWAASPCEHTNNYRYHNTEYFPRDREHGIAS
jgi:hypothetical protein